MKSKVEQLIGSLAEAVLNEAFDGAKGFNETVRPTVKTKEDLRQFIDDATSDISELVNNEAMRLLKTVPMSEVKIRITPSSK